MVNRIARVVVTAVCAAVPASASAITITGGSMPIWMSGYEYDIGRARVGMILSLSTVDSWQTADFNVIFRGHPRISSQFAYFSAAGSDAIVATNLSKKGQAGFIDYFDNQVNKLDLTLDGGNNTRLGFTLTSVSPTFSVWDALSVGFGFQHYFFAGEYQTGYGIRLDDPGITSYRLLLGDAAAVPLPPAIGMALGGLAALMLIAKKGKKGETPSGKTEKFAVEV